MPRTTKANVKDDAVMMDMAALRRRYPSFNIRCGIIPIRRSDGRMLIVKEKPRGDFAGNVYGPPKGSIRRCDRDFLAAACRELREETGIIIPRGSQLAPYEYIFLHKHFREILYLFLVLVDDDIVIRPDGTEISECCWMSLEDLKNCEHMATFTQRLVANLYEICFPTPDDSSLQES